MEKIERDGVYRVKEIAEVLDLSTQTIYRWIKSGDLCARKGFVTGNNVMNFLEGQEQKEPGKRKRKAEEDSYDPDNIFN